MSLLYITADSINAKSGGGIVTFHESAALQSLGPCEVWGREQLDGDGPEPWKWDERASKSARQFDNGTFAGRIKLAHFYAGAFGQTVAALKAEGCKITYTIAAHDRAVSRREHERFGMDFAGIYPHLCDEALWQRYITGYRLADVIVCPSTVAERTVRAYGKDFADKRIVVVPHGCDLPKDVAPLPQRFVCGYLGSFGLDKGVVYLMQAWKRLAYRDATLILAGRDSTSENVKRMWQQFGGGSVVFAGWQDSTSAFYDSISLLVQPSCTEGFGCEVLEAMSHGRPVLCSTGAGAVDLIGPESWRFPPCDVDTLAGRIDAMRAPAINLAAIGGVHRENAALCTWDKVRARYCSLWREVLS